MEDNNLKAPAPERHVDTSGWIKRKARVGRCCGGTHFAKGCERPIQIGELFMQSPYRVGLDRLELCMECARARNEG